MNFKARPREIQTRLGNQKRREGTYEGTREGTCEGTYGSTYEGTVGTVGTETNHVCLLSRP